MDTPLIVSPSQYSVINVYRTNGGISKWIFYLNIFGRQGGFFAVVPKSSIAFVH